MNHDSKLVVGLLKTGAVICCAALLMTGLLAPVAGCVHDPILMDLVEPVDTLDNPVEPVDTTGNPVITPCDSTTVYFQYDILPILVSNCSVSGCHDRESAESGVILTSYEDVIATTKVKPFNLGETELYEVLFLRDLEDRMPPSPREKLSQEYLINITQWILQGAEDLICDQDTTCSTANISYLGHIVPIIDANCKGCHSGANPSGGVLLSEYNGIQSVALSGRLYGAVARLPGFAEMPRNRDALPECDVRQIKQWVDDGAMDN